jgi:hypothetical protein
MKQQKKTDLKRPTEQPDRGKSYEYSGPFIKDIQFSGEKMIVTADNGQVISIRWDRYKLLRNSSESARKNFVILGAGIGIHWPELDEDLSLEGLIRDSQKED